MNAQSDNDIRGTDSGARGKSRGSARSSVDPRPNQYLVAPGGPRLGEEALTERINAFGIEIVRVLSPRGLRAPPVAIVRMPDDKAMAIRQAAGVTLTLEVDEPLRAASLPANAPTRLAAGVGICRHDTGDE
jgi:hypothetical protein